MSHKGLNRFWRESHYLILGNLSLLIGITSIVMQVVCNIEPCVLCLIQRFCFFFLGGGLILLHFSKYIRMGYWAGITITVLSLSVGMASSVRQLWLQSLPRGIHSACLPNFAYLKKVLGMVEAIRRVLLEVGASCGQVDFRILGLSLAHYAFLAFSFITVMFILKEYQARKT